ncbi:MAG: hypothetical protein ABIP78_04725 [Pyrinomonadaceae bacterium]
MEKLFLSSRSNLALILLTLLLAGAGFAQTGAEKKAVPPPASVLKKPEPTPAKGVVKVTTPEQVVESSIFLYGYPGGRVTLNQIRKTTLERGRSSYTASDGKVEQATYQRFVVRADKLDKEKIRLDQDFPSAKYSLVFNEEKIFGVYNNTVFTPREDASKGFENQIVHCIEAYLRYKENESKIELGPREKVMGVDFYVIDVTDKQDRKTRFYVSAKSFRVLMLTYEENGVKYRRKFYDYNYAQGTLVPYRTILWADEKIVEETDIGTVTYGQKVDDELFKSS